MSTFTSPFDESVYKVESTFYSPFDKDIPLTKLVQEAIQVSQYGGVILNPYYSESDLFATGLPYWGYGYTINERIIQ